MKRLIITLLMSVTLFITAYATHAADGFVIYTLPVKHRSPESLVDTLIPLIESGGHISTSGNKLILKTTPANFQQIALLVDELDAPVQQLLISVRQSKSNHGSSGGLSTQGNITTGKIRVDGKPIPTEQTVTVKKSTGWGSGESSYQLRALEGERVFLQSGQQVPIQSRYGVVGGIATSDYYQPVTSGVSVIARLRNGEVILDLSQEANAVDGRNIDTQSMRTQINARLGEWVQVGGIQGSSASNERGITRYQTSNQNTDTTIFIKVDKF
ncbi:secretin N-terminal domain-containing protein [Simiduia litorea]|uniref:hypothetical protein n=1 Tax=Simiduia litorea TaxID=1435348 RepID=UPI0036F42C9B